MDSETRICNLSATLARMGDNMTLLKQLAEFCREDLPVYMGRLKQAVDAKNAAEIRLAAHSVKGLVSNFDAQPVVNTAMRLEQMGQRGELAGAEVAYQELERQTDRLLQALQEELTKLEG